MMMTPERLREWRGTHKLTQEQLARVLGVTGQAVRNWEASRRPIPPWLRLALVGVVTELNQEATQ